MPQEPDVYDAPGFSPYDSERVETPAEPPEPEAEQAPDEPKPAQPEREELPEFDERHRESFVGLTFLGRLTETHDVWGHSIVVQTLTTEQNAKISELTARYRNTEAAVPTYQAGAVAAAVVSVDGQPLIRSLKVSQVDELELRYQYVMREWMPPVREAVYNKVFALEVRAREVLDAMGKASG